MPLQKATESTACDRSSAAAVCNYRVLQPASDQAVSVYKKASIFVRHDCATAKKAFSALDADGTQQRARLFAQLRASSRCMKSKAGLWTSLNVHGPAPTERVLNTCQADANSEQIQASHGSSS